MPLLGGCSECAYSSVVSASFGTEWPNESSSEKSQDFVQSVVPGTPVLPPPLGGPLSLAPTLFTAGTVGTFLQPRDPGVRTEAARISRSLTTVRRGGAR